MSTTSFQKTISLHEEEFYLQKQKQKKKTDVSIDTIHFNTEYTNVVVLSAIYETRIKNPA